MPRKDVPGFMAPDLGKSRIEHITKGIDKCRNGEERIKEHVARITERSSENGM